MRGPRDKNQGIREKIKIGVFDSGIGGKLIAQKIQKEIPNVPVLFKSDPAYFPYGNKNPQVILRRASHFVRAFEQCGCSLVVIACNTVTTNIIKDLRKEFPNIRFVGIEPPIKPIVALTKTRKVAVMGTEATIRSERLTELIKKFAGDIHIVPIACPGLAEFIEYRERLDVPGKSDPFETLKKFLDQPISEGIDVIGIACTHYSYLLPEMKKLYPYVLFYDPADAVVSRVKSETRL